MKNRDIRIDTEINDMKRKWQFWVEKIRVATVNVLPESSIKLIKNEHNDDSIPKIVIENPYLPSEKFMLENIIWEIIRRSELPIYNPFHIVLKSSKDSNLEVTISRPC